MMMKETDIKKQETSPWSRSKQDPRIVRVSKAFGGKDRHSKVCTVRGLRDSRVRLSVHTAIQLYDLQERLGLNQPSKVVDWLLNVAKNEIDELPPLQIPPGSFLPVIDFQSSAKHASEEEEDDDRHLAVNVENPNFVSGNNFIPSRENQNQNQNPISGFLNTAASSSSTSVPYNLTLSHPPRSHGLSEDMHNFSGFHHHQQQFLVYHQPGISTHSYFPPQMTATNFQISSSSPVALSVEPVIRPIHFNLLPDGQRKDSI